MSKENQASRFVEFSAKILGYWGMWPIVKKKTRMAIVQHWTHTAIVFIMMSVLLFGQISDLFTAITDVIRFSENSTLMFTMISMMCKLINLVSKRHKFKRLFDFLQCEEFAPKNKKHTELVDASARRIVLTARIYIYISLFTLISFLTCPLLEKNRRHPCAVKFSFLDVRNSPTFEVVYFFEIVSLTGLTLMNSSMDTLVAGFMSQAIAQLDCLNDSLRNVMDTNPLNEHTRNIHDANEISYRLTDADENIKNAVKHHCIIIRYITDIEDMFDVAFFFQYLVSGIVICCGGIFLAVIKPLENPLQVIALLSYLITMLSEIFMMCWFGNEIMTKSGSISESIYSSSWMDGSDKFKRSMRIILERAKVPTVIRPGKLFKLNLQSFALILNSAYSYFALLRHLYVTDQQRDEIQEDE